MPSLIRITPRSVVREYARGIYSKLGLDEGKVRKLMTGGPDGDLGSNEIKLTTSPTVAVVDGSGRAVRPTGHRQTGGQRREGGEEAESKRMKNIQGISQ